MIQHTLTVSFLFLLTLMSGCNNNLEPSQSLHVARKGIYTASLSSNGEHSVIGSIYDGGSFWQLTDNKRLFNWNHQANIQTTLLASDISYDGKWAVTADSHNIVLWNTTTGAGERFWAAPSTVLSISLAPTANTAVLGLDNNTAVIFDIIHGGIKQTLAHTNRVRSVDISADGKTIITGSEDFSAKIWHRKKTQSIATIQHQDDVQLVKLSDDGTLAISASKYDSAKIWSTTAPHNIRNIPLKAEYLKRGIRFICARFSSDNKYVLTGRPDQIVELWNVANATSIARWKLPKKNRWKPSSTAVIDVAFGNKENTFFAVGSNGYIYELNIP